MTVYANLEQARVELKSNNATQLEHLMLALRGVSRRIDELFVSRRPLFAPYDETRTLRWTGNLYDYNERTVRVRAPLLALTSIGVKQRGETSYTNLTGVTAYPDASTPIRDLYYEYWSSYYGAGTSLLQITGTWGYHPDYASAWDSVDTLQTGMAAAATDTELDVASIIGANSYGETPRFAVGSLVRVTNSDDDYEYMEIVRVDEGNHKGQVLRAQNGTTVQAFAAGDVVAVWRPAETVTRITARQAAMWVSRVGAFETAVVGEFGTTHYPADLTKELYATLGGIQYELH